MAEFQFYCPQCGGRIQCDTSYSGTQINCPVCQQSIVVPQPSSAAVAPPVPVKSQALRNVLVIVAAVVVLAGLVVGGWYGFSKIRMHIASGHLPPGLVALWSGEGDGSDSAGGNKMELTDISFVAGKVGKAFSFNGKSSSITIPASPALDVGAGDGFTIMAWIKPSDVRGYHPLFAWTDGTPVNSSICFNSSESGVLMVCVTDGAGNRFLVSNQGVLVKGRFQHIALTYDKASGVGTWYLNGVVVAQRKLSGNVNSTKGDLWISHRDTSQGNWSSNRSYAGLMDEVALYNRALSASEIKDICAEQNHGEPLTLPTPSTGWLESWMQ
jgi:hypothetical protein